MRCNITKKHVSKIKGVGILIAKYIGTTDELLQNSSLSDKLTGLIHPKFRFKYSGNIELTDRKIKLENWMDINLDEIQSIKCEFDDSFGRITINGDNRLGFYTKGEPLIITLIDQKIYLLINWNFTTGFTDNKKWFKHIEENLI